MGVSDVAQSAWSMLLEKIFGVLAEVVFAEYVSYAEFSLCVLQFDSLSS